MPGFPSCVCIPKRASSLPPHPEYSVMSCMTGRWEGSGRTIDGTSGSIKGICDLLCCRFHQEAHPGATGGASLWILPLAWTHTALGTSHPHPQPLCGWPSVCIPDSGKSEFWHMASEHSQMTSPKLWTSGRSQT